MQDQTAGASAPPAGQRGDAAPPAHDASPAHAAPGEQPASLGRTAGVIARSAVLPGSGHLATGHRRSGALILTVFTLVVVAAAVLGVIAWQHPETAATWTVQPRWLSGLRWGALVVAVLWVGVIVRSALLTRPGRRGWAGRALASGLVLVLSAVVALPAAAVVHYADVQRHFVKQVFASGTSSSSGATPAPTEQALGDGRLNVLLLGSDAGPDRTGARTDTVIVASLDTTNGRTTLFTLPRNLERVPFTPGSPMAAAFPHGFDCGSECLLNAIYAYGVEHPDLFPGDPDPGMTAVISGVSETLGLSIDYHAIVDLAGFASIVDALGGVTIRVERRLPIGGIDAYGNHVKPSGYIEPGLQHMDGQTALWYARSRSDSSDYERVLRQRCLLGAIQRQADPQHLLANFQQVATSTADALHTDIPQSLLPRLVQLAFKVKRQPVEALAFVPPLIDVTRPDISLIHADVQQAIAASEAAPSPTPSLSASAPAPGAATSAPAAPTSTPSPSPTSTPVSLSSVCSYS